jgi:D-amino-acid oxidase
MTDSKHAVGIGCGVIGLQTTNSLLTSPHAIHFKIAIIAAQLKEPVRFGAHTYSYPSCARDWHSQAILLHGDRGIRGWDQRTYGDWAQLLNGAGESGGEEKEGTYEERVQRYGLGFQETQYYWLGETPEAKGHDERDLVQGYRA